MKSYRIPFFNGLQTTLRQEGVEIEVVYGTPWAEEAKRGDNIDLPAPLGNKIQSSMIGGKILWMPVFRPLMQADYIVIEHASKNVINYPLALANALRLKRIASWGPGRDRQADPKSAGEFLKRRSLHWADWWFTYTAGEAGYVDNQGYASERITVVGNAIDTQQLRSDINDISQAEKAQVLNELGLDLNGKRLVYCGALYGNKRLDLMLPAVDAIRARVPDLQFIILGGGPLAEEVTQFASSRPWVRYVGPQFGRQKALFLSIGHVWLNPGLVGLGILDAFTAGLPLVTTDLSIHSPEIEYLEHGHNGLMVEPSISALTDALVALLESPEKLEQLQTGALASARKYSIESMVDNFATGALKWLKS
jgi:glycosyltransferase involved in cell wall biosynthesis